MCSDRNKMSGLPVTVTAGSGQHNSPPSEGEQQHAGLASAAELLQQLETAISEGNECHAQAIAAILARQRAKLNIANCPALSHQPKLLRVKIFVEDRLRTGSFIFMNLSPSMKFEELKRKMLLEYGFPPEVQVWIVGQRIARDSDTLERREVSKPGASMHLYLRSAESVGLTPHDYRIKYGHLFSTEAHVMGDRTLHTSPAVGSEHSVADTSRSPSQAKSQSPSQRKSRISVEDSSRQCGWTCPACTLINIATRPGCEICGHDRPASYKPPHNIDLPLSELERLQREAHYERLTQQLEEMQQREVEARGKYRQHLTREQHLHTLLQLNDQINHYRTRYPDGNLPRDVMEELQHLESQLESGIKSLRRLQHENRHGPLRVHYERGDGQDSDDEDISTRQVHVYLPGREAADDVSSLPAVSHIAIGDGNLTYIDRQPDSD